MTATRVQGSHAPLPLTGIARRDRVYLRAEAAIEQEARNVHGTAVTRVRAIEASGLALTGAVPALDPGIRTKNKSP